MNASTTLNGNVYSLRATELKTYLFAMLFILGNIIVPQLCHLVPQGGLIWLPIYFFTLIGAYKYGWRVGIMVAVASPIINSIFFGMPPAAMLPIILAKSIILGIIASFTAYKIGRVTLLGIIISVIGYQFIGSLAEWAITGSLHQALSDLRIGAPGIITQIIAARLVLAIR